MNVKYFVHIHQQLGLHHTVVPSANTKLEVSKICTPRIFEEHLGHMSLATTDHIADKLE